MKSIVKFIRESYAELKKVTWPSRDDVVVQTFIVIVAVAVCSMFLAVVDMGALKFIETIITF